MNHSRARDLLSAYLEQDLGDAERASLEAHLSACASCEADLEDLRGAIDLLRRLPDPEPPPFLATRVMARIAAGEGRSTGLARWLDLLGTPFVAAPVAAAGAALLVFSFAAPRAGIEVAVDDGQRAPGPLRGIVVQPVGRQDLPTWQPAAAWPDPRLLALNLRGASHPHSTALAAHFDDPVRAVAYSPR